MPAMGAARKAVKKVDHKGRVFTHVLAQMASPAPPLGSQLGQIGVNIAAFVKDFNLKTSIYKEGVPIPCTITVNPDRSYNLNMSHPPFPYFVRTHHMFSRILELRIYEKTFTNRRKRHLL